MATQSLTDEQINDGMKASKVDFNALFTDDQMYEYESNHNTRNGLARRMALSVLTKNNTQLVSCVAAMVSADSEDSEDSEDTTDGDAAMAVLETIKEWETSLEAELKMANEAVRRFLIAFSVIKG